MAPPQSLALQYQATKVGSSMSLLADPPETLATFRDETDLAVQLIKQKRMMEELDLGLLTEGRELLSPKSCLRMLRHSGCGPRFEQV